MSCTFLVNCTRLFKIQLVDQCLQFFPRGNKCMLIDWKVHATLIHLYVASSYGAGA